MPLVVLVGHCSPDASMLRTALRRAVPDARTERANSDAELTALAPRAALLLVNRSLDGAFSTDDGVALMDGLSQRPRWMLISNYPDAQHRAVAAGALRGFGKSEILEPRTLELLRAALLPDGGTVGDLSEGTQ